MRIIGLNTLFLIPNQVGGTEYLTRNFVNFLSQDKENSYVLFCNRENADTFPSTLKMKKVVCNVRATHRPERILYEQFIFPFLIQKEKCTLLHSFGYTCPLNLAIPQLTTIHDANWLDHPDDFTFVSRQFTRFLAGGAMRVSQQIITDSNYSKLSLQKHFPTHKGKISVVLPIISSGLFIPPFAPVPSSLKKKRYALCISAHYPHKQIPYLIKVWREVERRDKDCYLVLIGQHGKDSQHVSQLLQQCNRVLYYPRVSYSDLKTYYHYASLFLHPSIYEGFGYPVYEAYGSGLPILVGKRSMYEIEIQPALKEFSFTIPSDAQEIIKLVRESKHQNNRKLWSAEESIQSLLQVYEKCI